jgi:hypothetical protein
VSCETSPSQTAISAQERVDSLEAVITSLKADLEGVINDREFERIFKNADKVAYLTPGSDGYSTIRCDLGVLTVKLKDVEPYANGSRVVLTWGNPLQASINGLSTTIEWGSVDEEDMPVNEEVRSREVEFSELIRGGAWTDVEVVLEGVRPEQLGFVRIRGAAHNGIRLLAR